MSSRHHPDGPQRGRHPADFGQKEEPAWLLEWRLNAFRVWSRMTEPKWHNVRYPPIDYQSISYYAAPKQQATLESLDDVDPEIRATFEKLGISLDEQKRLSGVAVDAVFDSVSVATTFKHTLANLGIIFCSFSEAVRDHPDLVRKYLGTVVPHSDNFFAALNSAVFSDGSFAYIPKGVKCPMELSTYFRINAANTGQFERTLLVADEGAEVSYLEGCTAPQRDENQLHAAVVELVALDDATIKYSTVQNWYPGDKQGKGGIYNFVTKRGTAFTRTRRSRGRRSKPGSAITWKYPSCILQGDNAIGEFYSVAVDEQLAAGGYRDEDDSSRQEHAQHDRVEGHLGRARARTRIAASVKHRQERDAARAIIHSATRCSSATAAARTRFRISRSRTPPSKVEHEASTSKIGEDQIFYCRQRGHLDGRRREHDRQRLLQRRVPRIADGVRRRSAKTFQSISLEGSVG